MLGVRSKRLPDLPRIVRGSWSPMTLPSPSTLPGRLDVYGQLPQVRRQLKTEHSRSPINIRLRLENVRPSTRVGGGVSSVRVRGLVHSYRSTVGLPVSMSFRDRGILGLLPERVFTPATELCAAFYEEAVRPLLAGRPHSAALLGWGSDVLGYDTERSTDHGWGPRLLVFLGPDADVEGVSRSLDADLPEEFRGWPVRYGWDLAPVTHRVTVTTLPTWSLEHLGVDATSGMSTLDWLMTTQQRLLGVVAGAVYADDSGALSHLRDSLAWYPDQVWRWVLAC